VRSPFRRLSRRALIALNAAFLAASLGLIALTAVLLTSSDESPGGMPANIQDPGPLVTTVRTDSPVGRFEVATCTDEAHTVETPGSWFHPREYFYPPATDAPTTADLDHLVVEDGAVAVVYGADASAEARDALRSWGAVAIGVVIAPSTDTDAPPLEAYTATRRLRCEGVDLDRLTEFSDRHFSRPLQIEPHGEQSGQGQLP
jgi:Protein of unknown function (DUF3105)